MVKLSPHSDLIERPVNSLQPLRVQLMAAAYGPTHVGAFCATRQR